MVLSLCIYIYIFTILLPPPSTHYSLPCHLSPLFHSLIAPPLPYTHLSCASLCLSLYAALLLLLMFYLLSRYASISLSSSLALFALCILSLHALSLGLSLSLIMPSVSLCSSFFFLSFSFLSFLLFHLSSFFASPLLTFSLWILPQRRSVIMKSGKSVYQVRFQHLVECLNFDPKCGAL